MKSYALWLLVIVGVGCRYNNGFLNDVKYCFYVVSKKKLLNASNTRDILVGHFNAKRGR